VKLTTEQIQAEREMPAVAYRMEAGGARRVIWLYSFSPPMERRTFLSVLLSLPVIRWFAPKCAARISECIDAPTREASGDLRCTKPRWHKGQHFFRNPH